MKVQYELSPEELKDILELLRDICDLYGVKDSLRRTVFERLQKIYCK